MNLDKIISRLKIFLKIQDDKGLAEILGLSPQDFANRYRSGTLLKLIMEFVLNKRVNLNWIFWGKGNMFLEEAPLKQPIGEVEIVKEVNNYYGEPVFYKVISRLSGKCTIVTAEEMDLIYDLLCILKSGDSGLIEAIKTNLREFKRLSKILNPHFGDIIILERRVKNEPIERVDRRQKIKKNMVG